MMFIKMQAKINDRGIAALAYNVLLRPGVTVGLGASFDTQKFSEGGHKVGFLTLPFWPDDPRVDPIGDSGRIY